MSEFTANQQLAATATMPAGNYLWDDRSEVMFERKPLKFASIYDDRESPEVACKAIGDVDDADTWFIV